jgi:hypothetical protein
MTILVVLVIRSRGESCNLANQGITTSITTVVKRHCKLGACNKGVYNRKRPFGIYNSDNDKRDRKLHSTIYGNRLHTMYKRNSKSGVSILT